MASLFTQEEIVNDLQEEGINVTIRDLRYWRQLGQLPPLKESRYYDDNQIYRIKWLAYNHKKFDPISFKLEGIDFDVERIEIIKHNDKFIYIYHCDGFFLVQEKEELNVRGKN